MADQLNEIGVPPEDIEYLAVSHSHFDHAGNAALFTNAKLIVMAQELSFFEFQICEREWWCHF